MRGVLASKVGIAVFTLGDFAVAFWNKKSGEFEDESLTSSAGSPVQSTPPPAVLSPTPAILGANDSIVPAGSAQMASAADSNRVRCALGVGTSINGKLSFDTSVQIDGKMKGELFTSKTLIVGSSGVVEAQLDASCLIISGRVKGTIKVADKLEIKAGGVLEGEVYTPCLVIEEGGRFEGNVFMGVTVSGTAKLPHAHKANVKAASAGKNEVAHSDSLISGSGSAIQSGVAIQ